jgi:hypothetical protein
MTRIVEPVPEPGPHQPTFEVCIDEAGDDGMNCVCGEWMIVSAYASLRVHYQKDVELVRGLKADLKWKDRKPLHFRDMKEEGKRLTVQRIVENPQRIRLMSVLLHKPSLNADEEIAWYHKKHRIYFYLVRLLLERVSWSCRDSISVTNRKRGNGTARIVFSAREDLSYDDLAAYFSRLQEMETRIEWGVIRPDQFKVLKNGKHPGLQLADAIASGMYCCDHHCEPKRTDEWARVLKPAVYHYRQKYIGYGIKIFPSEAEKKMAQRALAPWATEYF